MVPDHLMLYCTASPGWSVRTSVPDPGEQSAVDHTRAPPEVYTEKTCSVPDRSRVHATVPRFATETPMIGCWPTAKLGAPVVAVSFRLESGHNSRPNASVAGATLVGLGVVEGFGVGVGPLVRTGALFVDVAFVDEAFVDVVGGDPVGADLLGPVAGPLAGDDVETPVFAPAGAPDAVGAPVGLGVVVAVVPAWVLAGRLIRAPELAAPLATTGLDPAVVVGTRVDCAAGEDAAETAAEEAGAEADSRSDARTPVSDGAADPLVKAARLPASFAAPLDRPATRKITPNKTATPATTTMTLRSQ